MITLGTEAVFNAALALPEESRAALADILLESLPDASRNEIYQAWVQEATKRMDDFDKGKTKAIPGEEVFRSLRARWQ